MFVFTGAIGFMRIASSKTSERAKKTSLLILAAIVLPGLILSISIPFLITREPPIGLEIISPNAQQGLVAPVSITFGVEKAIKTLSDRGIRTTAYRWDVNADSKVDQETVVPRLTVNFDREGVYVISTTLVTSDGKNRRVSIRFTIGQAVFVILPNPPVVKKPVVLSIANLIADPTLLKEVQWDFNDDGKADETTTSPQVAYTFYQTGDFKVSALVLLNNATQASYSRTITVVDPTPLPFPVEMITEPKGLISPPPFGVLFRIDTKEPVALVEWDFGDGEKGDGNRVLHEFRTKGTYVVTAKVRAQSGTSATLDTLVRVVDELPLNDLVLDSSVPINGSTIESTVPLRLDITPKTGVQFVQFSWEAPEASEVGSTEGKLQAVYRQEGSYKVTMLAQDVVNRATRRTFTVVVKPQEAVVDFNIVPETGVAPLTVKLDSSDTTLPPNETPTGYLWKCEERQVPVARGGISSCTYDSEGTYEISLIVRTQSGKEFIKKKTIVVRPPIITACFIPSRSRAKVGQSIEFDPSCSAGDWTGLDVLWDFGDRTQIDWKVGDEKPIHAYTEAGSMTVTLTFMDPVDSSRKFTTTRTITIEP